MFGDLSFSHILILLLVLVLVFGAKRIPEIGKSIGQGIKEFNRSLKDATNDQSSAPPRNLSPPGPSSSVPSSGDPKRSEEHTSELQSQSNLVCRLLLEKKTIPHM